MADTDSSPEATAPERVPVLPLRPKPDMPARPQEPAATPPPVGVPAPAQRGDGRWRGR